MKASWSGMASGRRRKVTLARIEVDRGRVGRRLDPGRSVEMDDKSREVLEAALSLPEDQRASLVEALLQTLPPGSDEWDDDELASELDRRLEEALDNPSSTVSWTELKARG
jgi:putative addiction module component (TIGR02574 family)